MVCPQLFEEQYMIDNMKVRAISAEKTGDTIPRITMITMEKHRLSFWSDRKLHIEAGTLRDDFAADLGIIARHIKPGGYIEAVWYGELTRFIFEGDTVRTVKAAVTWPDEAQTRLVADPEISIMVQGGLVQSVVGTKGVAVAVYDLDRSDYPDAEELITEKETADEWEALRDEARTGGRNLAFLL